MSQAGKFATGSSGGGVQTLNLVPPIAGNIDLTSTGGSITIMPNIGGGTVNLDVGGAFSNSFPTDSVTAVPLVGVLNLFGGSNISTSAAGNTVTTRISGTTNHAVQIGNAGGSLTSLAVGTNGQVLIGSTGADPAFATLTSSDGSILFTTGAHSLSLQVAGGTTSVIKIGGNTGVASPVAGEIDIKTANATPKFVGSGSTVTLDFAGNNLVLGGTLPALAGGINNTGMGSTSGGIQVFQFLTGATANSAFGQSALQSVTSSSSNSAFGANAITGLSTGSGQNTAIGVNSLLNLGSGTNNLAAGYSAGSGLTTSDSNNIFLANAGSAGLNNTIKIGTNGTHTATFVAGIDGVNIGSVAKVLTMASDQIGTASILPGANITVTPGANSITIASTAISSISITGDSGGPLSGTAFTFTGGTTGLTFAGAGTTETLGGTLIVANGGTGRATLTNHGVLIGAGTSAITQLGVASTGSALMGVTGADPAFTGSPSFSGSVTAATTITATSGAITATSGNVVISAGNLTLPATTSSSLGNILIAGNRTLHAYGATGDNNLFVGQSSGNYTMTVGVAQANIGVGPATLTSVTNGHNNTATGYNSLNALSSGTLNTAAGSGALAQLQTGSWNCAFGRLAGFNYTGAESSNISIGFSVLGTTGESNCLRIGTGNGTGNGQLSTAFIQGISGVTVTGTAVLCSTAGQLGTIASSIKFKENVTDMGAQSEILYKLRPVTFNFKKDETKHIQWGCIAEEVEEVCPDLVVHDVLEENKGQPFSVRYLDIIPMLLNEVQKLRKELNELKGI